MSEDPQVKALTGAIWMTVRALLALVLMVGFYVVALGIAAVLLYLPYAEVVYAERLHLKLAAFCVIGAVLIIGAVLPRRDRFSPPWPTITQEQEPKLFHLVESIAQATRQRMPRTVYLTPEVNAWVAERGGVLGIGSRRVMGLGLPLLAVLSERELRAVLAHEFGHFHGGDTKLGPIIYRTRAAMARTIAALEHHSSVLQWVFIAYGTMYLKVTHAISRHQERLADALAARVAGGGALARALRTLHGASAAFDSYWSNEATPVLSDGFLPPLAAGFQRFVAAERVARAMEETVARALAEEETGDTHPPLRERVQALERIPDPGTPEDGPALMLFTGLAARERELVSAVLKPDFAKKLQKTTWDEVPERVYRRRYDAMRERYATYFVGTTIAGLAARAQTIAAAIGAHVADEVGEVWQERERLRQGSWVIGAIVAAALARAGWSLVAAPGDPLRLVRDGASLDPFELVNSMVAGEIDAEAWVAHCTTLGIAGIPLTADGTSYSAPPAPPSIQRSAPTPKKPAPAASSGVQCWSCKTPLPVTDETRGQKVACPQCGTRQRLPR